MIPRPDRAFPTIEKEKKHTLKAPISIPNRSIYLGGPPRGVNRGMWAAIANIVIIKQTHTTQGNKTSEIFATWPRLLPINERNGQLANSPKIVAVLKRAI